MFDFESAPIATLLLTDLEYFPTILDYAKRDFPICWDSWLLFYFEADSILQQLRTYNHSSIYKSGRNESNDAAAISATVDHGPDDLCHLRDKFHRLLSSVVVDFESNSQSSPFDPAKISAIKRLLNTKIPLVSILSSLLNVISGKIVDKCCNLIDLSRFTTNSAFPWGKVRHFIVKDVKIELLTVLRDSSYIIYFQHYLLHKYDSPTLVPVPQTSNFTESPLSVAGMAEIASISCWSDIRKTLDTIAAVDFPLELLDRPKTPTTGQSTSTLEGVDNATITSLIDVELAYAVFKSLLRALREISKSYCNLVAYSAVIKTRQKGVSNSSNPSPSNLSSSLIDVKEASSPKVFPYSSRLTMVNKTNIFGAMEFIQENFVVKGGYAVGISESSRLDIATIINYTSAIRLGDVESLDIDFILAQISKISKLFKIMERDIFHHLQLQFADFVDESFEYAQLVSYYKTKDTLRVKNKRALDEFFTHKVMRSGIISWSDKSAGRTTFMHFPELGTSCNYCLQDLYLGLHHDPVLRNESVAESKNDGGYFDGLPNTFDSSIILGEIPLYLLLQIIILLVTGRSVIVSHRCPEFLRHFQALVPRLAWPFRFKKYHTCPNDVFSRSELLNWFYHWNQSDNDVSEKSMPWFIAAMSSCFAVEEKDALIDSLMGNDQITIFDLDRSKVISQPSTLGLSLNNASMFRKYNSGAYRQLHKSLHSVNQRSDPNTFTENAFAAYWNDCFLYLLPENIAFYPSHNIISCDVHRSLTRLYQDKKRNTGSNAAFIRESFCLQEQQPNGNVVYPINGAKHTESTSKFIQDVKLSVGCGSFDDVETLMIAELVGHSLPCFKDLLERHAEVLTAFAF